MANRKMSALLTLLVLTTVAFNPAAARDLLATAGSSSSSGTGSVGTCATASASAGLGGAASAFSRDKAAVIAASAQSCASAAATAYGSICSGGDTIASAATFAETCANSVAAIYISSFSSSSASGFAAACSNGCASGAAIASSIASAVSSAVAAAGACDQVQAAASSSAFSAALAQVTGQAWTVSCSAGPYSARSSASAQAFVKALASGYAKAFAQVVAATCGGSGSCSKCHCSIGSAYPLDSVSEALATVSGGFYAVAAAWGEAGAAVCSHGKPLETAASGVLAAWGQTCVDAIIKLKASTYSSGNSFSCAGVFTSADAGAIAQSASNMLALAFNYNFKNPNCPGAYAFASGEVFNTNFVEVFTQASAHLCSSGAGSFTDVDIATYISTYPTFSSAIATALSSIDSCVCATAPFCPGNCGCYTN